MKPFFLFAYETFLFIKFNDFFFYGRRPKVRTLVPRAEPDLSKSKLN